MLTPRERADLAAEISQRVLEALRAEGTPLLVDSVELAKRLSVSVSTIDRWTASGRIPRVRVGSVRRYDPADVLAAMKAEAVA
ncbi:MAG: helix-turn-helix domain-containing protein [Bdellovibrionales bacterium]|nr:helix-turn-helix domain-containing protein [Planctomycetales bacterium]MCB0346165.1 helix-turn-helix domain-containing protein [Bdellovibrionales bacterium]